MKRTYLCVCLLALASVPVFAKDVINYQDHIRPIFQQSCFNCHNADRARGGLDLTSYRATLAGGSSGEIVMSQSPDASSLFGVMNHTLEPKMPPNGGKVADDKLELVKLWIDQGLRETANSQANKPKKPRVDLSVGKAAVGRPAGPPIMPEDMPLGPIHHTPRPGAVSDVAGHPWSPIVAVTGQKQVLVHHTETGELIGVVPFDYGQPQTLTFSWTGKLLMVGGGVGGASGTVVLYDVKTGEEVSRVGDEVDEVLAADLDPTQRFVALGGPSKRVKGYAVATGELIYNLDKHTEWVTAIAFSPDGDYLASGDRNGGIHIWEADSGLHVYRLDGHSKAVTELSWRYDGKVLASSGEDGQARLWEMKTGKQVKSWNAHGSGVMSIAFAEDGRLVTTGRDQMLRVWDAKGGKKLETKALSSIGLSAAFDTASKSVIAGDLMGQLVHWSLQGDAKQVQTLSSNPPPITAALSQSAAQVESAQAALAQKQADVQKQAARLEQAQKATADADAALKANRQAIKAGEQDVPKLDAARKEAIKQYDQSVRALRGAQQAQRQASKTLKAKQGESRRLGQEVDRAKKALDTAKAELSEAEKTASAAEEKAKKNPDDQALIDRAADLMHRLSEAREQLKQREAEVVHQAERLSATEKQVDDANTHHHTQTLKVDQAQQMEKARKQERDEANTAYHQAREVYNQARQQARPSEGRLKKATEAQANAKAAMDKAAADTLTVEQDLAQAKRAVAKWQSAELRLKIDALRAKRDELRDQDRAVVAQRDQKAAEVASLSKRLTAARQALSDIDDKINKQGQAIAEAKQRVEQVAKQVDPAKPASAEALEDAQFDLETEVYTVGKLKEEFALKNKQIPAIQGQVKQAKAELNTLNQAVAKQPKDTGAQLQSEIDTLLPRYQALREEAGL